MFFERQCELWASLPAPVWRPLHDFVLGLDVAKDTRARHEIAFARPANRVLLVAQFGRPAHAGASAAAATIIEYVTKVFGKVSGEPLHGRAIYRAELSFVGPGSSVLEHHDPCRFHQICHRLHVPIVTRGSVIEARWFRQDHWSAHTLRAGHLYQLNNRIPHRLANRTDATRVHLILDYAPLEELQRWQSDRSDSHAMVPCQEGDPEYGFIGPMLLGKRSHRLPVGEHHE